MLRTGGSNDPRGEKMKAALVALFAGMLGGGFVQPASAADPVVYKEKVLHSFVGVDGQNPRTGLIDVKGTLYGTAGYGGDYEGGILFSLDRKTGAETILYSFPFEDDPQGPVIEVKGTLYGTTNGADTTPPGTVFSFDLGTGEEKTLYSFCSQANCTDGAYPAAGLIHANGMLYGTTAGGGASANSACGDSGCGTVFSLNRKTGAETVLYSFCSQANCTDGAHPSASLIEVNGILYGTTPYGGVCFYGCGTVFSVDPGTDAENVLYTFCSQANCTDGAQPVASLIEVNGLLYGTAQLGGDADSGVVFSIDPTTGAETVLHAFAGGTDGAYPLASLINQEGILYGTTEGGGGGRCNGGCGTVFSVDPSTGAETVLYSFCSQGTCSDGKFPEGGLLDVRGKLYGTTVFGGAHPQYGAVFELKRKR
jgi:uncharacterized repeat protein (TIGR03803 family)